MTRNELGMRFIHFFFFIARDEVGIWSEYGRNLVGISRILLGSARNVWGKVKYCPSLIISSKISSIIVWKVAGLLVRPKNMTKGSNNPRLVRKAAFHSSPSFIRTLLKPHRTSSFVK